MGVVGTYTGHRRPDKLVSGSAFEEVREYSAPGRELSNLRSHFLKKYLTFSFISGSQEGSSVLLTVLARSPATQRAHLTNHGHERR